MTSKKFDIVMQFYGKNKENLARIINKGIKLVDYNTINSKITEYALNTSPSLSLKYFFTQYFELSIILILILMLILFIFAMMLLYAKSMQKEQTRMQIINQERSDFFARMSHDMRTPMNGILGMINLSENETNLQEIHENIKKAKQSGEYMLCLINDTLDLQRLESDKLILQPETIYIEDFANNISDMIKPSTDKKNIKFINIKDSSFFNYYIKADSVRLKQIFVNILSNSVKFTNNGGIIEVITENLATSETSITEKITIRDTRIGMSPAFIQNNLFKPYTQERNVVTSQYAGSGLGLAIVKNLVTLMNGTIDVKSELGKGTTFTIVLTFEIIKKEDTSKINQPKNLINDSIIEKLSDKNILICEDQPLNAEITKRLLLHAKCNSEVAQNGKIGLEMFQKSNEHYYDAIIMDIRMPIMNGLESTLAIRALNRSDAKSIPIIAMTANAYDEDIKNCLDAGMNAHISKPVDPQNLFKTLAAYL